MKEVIAVDSLSKEFKSKQKMPGLKGSLKSLFRPNYKRIRAVDRVTFSVRKGELVGFIGPNGAGKSTTIKMMTGILFPDSGDISVLGFHPQRQRKQLAYHIGTVFGQKPQLWFHLPAIDTYYLFAKIYDLEKRVFERRLKRLVKQFEVKDIIHQPVRKLSLGQRMRCEMIASLLHKPKVLFLDEPTIGLDIVVKKRIRELITTLNRREGLTIILTSHDMEDVERICDRLIMINHGKIMYDGSTEEMRKRIHLKRITVVLSNRIKSMVLKGATTQRMDEYTWTVEIDTQCVEVADIISRIVSMYAVDDITVVDPPIEEIIEELYAS